MDTIKTSQLAFYTLIALIFMAAAYYLLAQEPHPDWPINLIHLLSRH